MKFSAAEGPKTLQNTVFFIPHPHTRKTVNYRGFCDPEVGRKWEGARAYITFGYHRRPSGHATGAWPAPGFPSLFTLLPLLGVLVGWLACCNANQISMGKTQGCEVLVAWIVGCLVGYQCKYRQHLGKVQFGCLVCLWLGGLPTLSFLHHLLWLVCWLVRPAWLVVCLDLGKTHKVMDGSWTGRKVQLFGVLLAWFPCRD